MKKYIIIAIFFVLVNTSFSEVPRHTRYTTLNHNSGAQPPNDAYDRVTVGSWQKVDGPNGTALRYWRQVDCEGNGSSNCLQSITQGGGANDYPTNVNNAYDVYTALHFNQMESGTLTGSHSYNVASNDDPSKTYTINIVWSTDATGKTTFDSDLIPNQ